MYRIVFMGTPEFAVPSLQALIDTQQVVGVVTQPDRPAGRGKRLQASPVKQVALNNDLPIYQPRSLKQPESADPLRAWKPDALVVAAFGQILRTHVLQLPPRGCYNVHASLLPRWRGASPIQHALLAGDAQTGITLMQMDEGLDTGPMLVQEAIPITDEDTAASLHDRLAELGAAMLRNHLDAVLSGEVPPRAQDGAQATYAPMIKKEAGQIDWEADCRQIDRHIRAMTPWPTPFTTWEGEQLKIWEATPLAGFERSGAEPGMVLEQGDTIIVQTGHGGLQLENVQLAGKRALPVAEFVRGRPDFIGSRLGQVVRPR